MAAVNQSAALREGSGKGKSSSHGDALTVPAHLTANFAKVDTSLARGTKNPNSIEGANQAWLLKIPHALMEAWKDAPEGTELGKLVFTKGLPAQAPAGKLASKQQSGASSSANGHLKKLTPPSRARQTPLGKARPGHALRVEVAPNIVAQRPEVPSKYSIEAITSKIPTMVPFSRHSATMPGDDNDGERDGTTEDTSHATKETHEEGTVTFHGLVTKSATLQMQRDDEQYRRLLKTRLLDNVAKKNKNVKSVDASELTLKTGFGRVAGGGATMGGGTGNAGFGDSIQRQGKRMLEARDRAAAGIGGALSEKAESLKRKFEGQSVRSILFELFSQQSYWTAKELRMVSGRTEKEIRPVLQELGHYIKNGEHKGMWELKSEFQMQAGPAAANGVATSDKVP